MPLTTSRGYPYPTPADPVNVPADIQRLAEAINNDVGNNKVNRTGDTMTGTLNIGGTLDVALRLHSTSTPMIDFLSADNTRRIMGLSADNTGATLSSESGRVRTCTTDAILQHDQFGYLQIQTNGIVLSSAPQSSLLYMAGGYVDTYVGGVHAFRVGPSQIIIGNGTGGGVWWGDTGSSASVGRSVSVINNALGGTNTYIRRDEAACADGMDMTQYLRTKSGALGLIGAVRIDKGMTGVAFLTGSDYRMKNIVGPMENATAIVQSLKPQRFTSKLDPSKEFVGFLAHEVAEVLPGLVWGEKDAVYTAEEVGAEPNMDVPASSPPPSDPNSTSFPDPEPSTFSYPNLKTGDPKIQLLDTIGMVPVLVAALQEMETRLAALESTS